MKNLKNEFKKHINKVSMRMTLKGIDYVYRVSFNSAYFDNILVLSTGSVRLNVTWYLEDLFPSVETFARELIMMQIEDRRNAL